LQYSLNRSLIPTKPFSYLDMLSLLSKASLVLTDSGGIQEEACLLHVPCLTIRNNTERVTTVTLGANHLIKVGRDSILSAINELVENGIIPWKIPIRWDKQVATRILDTIENAMVMLSEAKSNNFFFKGERKWS